ncbi:MAG: hypothetical protein A3D92_08730 [Bacteroidetes bacterium RIFCSPHIGHO2_02_FULL_44_7]|nr:MAG: hypothetical protein A3D92_08730 [Bacteroidetes bacterium RIFCSPHIGHO2_02_FULL_44_7]
MDTITQKKAPAFRTWMGEDGIARSYVSKNAEIGISEAVENSNTVNALYSGSKFPLLVNITEIRSISREARSHFSVNNRDTHITAFALVGKSAVGKIVANFFFRLNRVAVPARMFVSEDKALLWLENFKSTVDNAR